MAEVVLTGTITPTDITDIYATHDAIYGKGGLRSVADYLEREAISDERRTEGMIVFTIATNEYWKLLPGPWSYNSLDWEPFSAGGGGTPDNVTIGTNTAGELYVIDGNDPGHKRIIEIGESVVIPTNNQYLIYGDLTVNGTLTSSGEVVLINGALILGPFGVFNNTGTLILAGLETTGSKFKATFTSTAGVPFTITHSLNSIDFVYQVRNGNDDAAVDLVRLNNNQVQITTAVGFTGTITFVAF